MTTLIYTSDKQTLEVNTDQIKQFSNTIKNILDDCGEDGGLVPVGVTAEMFKYFLAYMQDPEKFKTDNKEMCSNWKFTVEFMTAVDTLDNSELLTFIGSLVAEFIKDKPLPQVHALLAPEEPHMTYEEYKTAFEENEWCITPEQNPHYKKIITDGEEKYNQMYADYAKTIQTSN